MTVSYILQTQPQDTTGASGFDAISAWFTEHPVVALLGGLVTVVVLAYVVDKLTKRVLSATVGRVIQRTSFTWDDTLARHRVFDRLAHLPPAIAIYYGVQAVPGLPPGVITVLQQAALAAMVLVAVFALGAALSAGSDIYDTSPLADGRPIKGYVQVAKIALYLLGAVIAIATLTGRQVFLLLSGLGAMTAVLLFVFRDTLLSFVASIQIASYDLMRVGDWIEMPQYNADGDVVDIGLHSIKVQNWDKTITTIPTHKFLSDAFKNWRSMSEAGGRRIKRALHLDMHSIRFLDDTEIDRFEQFVLLRDYIQAKKKELADFNASVEHTDGAVANARHLTNVGTFRVYVVEYLRQHPKIHPDLTLMVRQLNPTPQGLPMEIYVFSNDTNWVPYEGIQADIFDHVIAIVPEFGLRVYQQPSGHDLQTALVRS
jgi:miniconductance mechanosensitive channel